MHTEHAHWLVGNSLMSLTFLMLPGIACKQKKGIILVCTCVCVYVCTCVCLYTHLKTLIPPDKLWHDASMNCSGHTIPSSRKAASLYSAVISMLAKIGLLE